MEESPDLKSFAYRNFMLKVAETTDIDKRIHEELEQLEPITLQQMKEIRLMNRTDTKFVTTKQRLVRLLQLCKGQYFAQFHCGSRIASYKTTYWDTEGHFYYMQHHDGRAPRQKVRVRTYMDSKDTFLEVKTKNNHGRTKKKRILVSSQDVRADEIGDSKGVSIMVDDFLGEQVRRSLADIHPTVQNQFHRITLVNYGKTERLTIDFDIMFHNYDTNLEDNTGNLVIVELKRDGNVYSPILSLLRELRIKPHGFSKYCIGSVMTNPALKQNLFKPKLRSLRKISEQI